MSSSLSGSWTSHEEKSMMEINWYYVYVEMSLVFGDQELFGEKRESQHLRQKVKGVTNGGVSIDKYPT